LPQFIPMSTSPKKSKKNKKKKDTPQSETPKPEENKSELPPLEKKILRQVEFYFSDSNLPKDKFLMNLLPTDNGWIPIATIAAFKRMRSLTNDLNAVVDALRKSPSLLAVSDDGLKVKRIPPLPENVNERILKHSIYAKGFPTDITIETVTDFFQAHGDVKCVRLRKGGAKRNQTQKDSVFVEFSSEDEAKQIAAKEIKAPNSDALLKMLLKTDYLAKKKAEYEQKNKSKGEDGNQKNKENKEKQKKEKQANQKQTNKRKKLDDEGNLIDETPEKKSKNR